MTPLQPADGAVPAPGLAEKLSALVARTQRPVPSGDTPTAVVPALTELAAELRGDLISELGDLRAEIAAVGDEATEASGRINGRAEQIATTLTDETDRADRRSAQLVDRLDALEAKVDAFALDLSAALRDEGTRLETVLRSAIEESALVLAETLLTVLAPGTTETTTGTPEPAQEPVAAGVPPEVEPTGTPVEATAEPAGISDPDHADPDHADPDQAVEASPATSPPGGWQPAADDGSPERRGLFGRGRR